MKKILAILSLISLFSWNVALATAPTQALDLEITSAQYATAADSASLSITGAMSICAKVKLESLPANDGNDIRVIYSKNMAGGTGTDILFAVLKFNNIVYVNMQARGDATHISETYGSGFSYSVDTWYSICGVFTPGDDQKVKVYVNGTAQTDNYVSNTATTIQNTTSIGDVGGQNPYTTGRNWDGKLSDIRMWARAITTTEVTNYSTNPCTFENGANLNAWWTLDNTYNDSSGNSNTLTPVNSPAFASDGSYTCDAPAVERGTQIYIFE
jgi:hypothetical protein